MAHAARGRSVRRRAVRGKRAIADGRSRSGTLRRQGGHPGTPAARGRDGIAAQPPEATLRPVNLEVTSRLIGGRGRDPLDPDKDSMFVRWIPFVGRLRQLEPQVPCACELFLGHLAKVEVVVTQEGHVHSRSSSGCGGNRAAASWHAASCASGSGRLSISDRRNSMRYCSAAL